MADVEKLREALETAKRRFKEIAVGAAYQPAVHAGAGIIEIEAALYASPPSAPAGVKVKPLEWPHLTEAMIRAACKAHYGSDEIDGIAMTSKERDWNFRQAFKRMWKGARTAAASASAPAQAEALPAGVEHKTDHLGSPPEEESATCEGGASSGIAASSNLHQRRRGGAKTIAQEPRP